MINHFNLLVTTPEGNLSGFMRHFNLSTLLLLVEDITGPGRKSIERSMLMKLFYRFCQITQPEIGFLVGGIDYRAVSQTRKRLQVKLEQDPKMKDRLIN